MIGPLPPDPHLHLLDLAVNLGYPLVKSRHGWHSSPTPATE